MKNLYSSELPERSQEVDLRTIQWEYPIRGYPELTAKDTQPAVVMCQARERIEERLEVTLSGVAPAAAGPKRGIKTRAKTPANGDKSHKAEGVVVGEGKTPYVGEPNKDFVNTTLLYWSYATDNATATVTMEQCLL